MTDEKIIIVDGTRIEYTREDSGAEYPVIGLLLAPGEVYTVGEDLDADFASRLVEDSICRVIEDTESADVTKADPPVTEPLVTKPAIRLPGPTTTAAQESPAAT